MYGYVGEYGEGVDGEARGRDGEGMGKGRGMVSDGYGMREKAPR